MSEAPEPTVKMLVARVELELTSSLKKVVHCERIAPTTMNFISDLPKPARLAPFTKAPYTDRRNEATRIPIAIFVTAEIPDETVAPLSIELKTRT
jgi:hypothetical protein